MGVWERERVLDVVAGSAGIDRVSAESILQHSTEPTNAADAEWPMIIDRLTDGTVAFHPTEGLEFETATFWGADIFEKMHKADIWNGRLTLATATFEAAMRVEQLAQSRM